MKKLLISLFIALGMAGALATAQNQSSLGTVGPRGYTGARGPAGTIRINSVATVDPGTPASVNNVGDATNAQWNMNIPRGAVILGSPGEPVFTVGGNGDWYIDTQAGCLYGPKASGAWPTSCLNLVGVPGNQPPHYVFAGPLSGASTAPTFRLLQMVDLPADVAMSTVTMRVTSPTSLVPGDTKTYLQVDYSGTIVGWSIIADQPGSINVDVWKVASSAPPSAPSIPTSAAKISNTAPVTLNNAQSASVDSSGIVSWLTTAVSAYDVFGFNITSASTVSAVTVQIFIQRN